MSTPLRARLEIGDREGRERAIVAAAAEKSFKRDADFSRGESLRCVYISLRIRCMLAGLPI